MGLHKSGKTLSCCNPFGESMLHMVCRRGYSEMLSFLLEEVEVSVRIIDDSGRNPLRDALWNSNCNFDVVSMLIYRDPSLLLFSDKRGHSPFTYARKEHWRQWKYLEFLTKVMKSSIDQLIVDRVHYYEFKLLI